MAKTTPRKPRISNHPAWILWIAVGSVTAMTTPGCAASGDDEASASASKDEIFGGIRDDDPAARLAVVALRVGTGPSFELCSGTLLSPNLVLTAKHCVVRPLAPMISCDEQGRSTSGPQVGAGYDPRDIAVYVGASPSFSRTPNAYVKDVVTPEGDTLCDSDIALVVLDRALAGIEPFAVRFGAHARLGEQIRAVGYGQNDARMPMGTRFRREKVPVLAVGSAISPSMTRLGPREFEVGESICVGDSGGPAISEITGAVIGVVSRGGPCGEDHGHVYVATSGFEDLFERAFARAGGKAIVEANTPPADMEASPRASGGEPTSPSVDASASSGGCAMSSTTRSSAGMGMGLVLGALALLSRRRSRPRAR